MDMPMQPGSQRDKYIDEMVKTIELLDEKERKIQEFLRAQAELNARFLLEALEKRGFDLTKVVVLDLGCGGISTRVSSGSTYLPYFLGYLGKELRKDQLIGFDASEQASQLSGLYTHFRADFNTILQSEGDFQTFLFENLTDEQRENLVVITSNNLFANSPPGYHNGEDHLEVVCEVAREYLPVGGFVMTFDGWHQGNGLGVAIESVTNDRDVVVDSELDAEFKSRYEAAFGYDE